MRWLLVTIVLSAVFSAGTAAKSFRWCTVNDKEVKKCEAFKNALGGIAKMAAVDVTPACVKGADDEDCMKKIKDNKADFITLDGGKIYQAGKCYDLAPIVAESYGPPEGISYYAVAVAKNNTSVTFKTLKGKKSCHTGYRKTAGWNMPVGRLLDEKIMENKGLDVKSAAAFFSQSCVPGAPDGYANLCKLCKSGTCSKTDEYSNYHGAFKCMADGKGDVAFVKQLTTGEVVKDGNYGNMSDYKYLCTDGSSKVVTNTSHESCNLGSNPSHAVVARKEASNADFVKVLLKASEYCQSSTAANNCSGFLIFDSTRYGGKDLLFKDSTKKLVAIPDNKNTYKTWLGAGYLGAMEGLGNTECSGVTRSVNPLPVLLAVLVFLKAIL